LLPMTMMGARGISNFNPERLRVIDMAIISWIEITCDSCTEGSGLRFSSDTNAVQLRAEFKAKGWVRRKTDGEFVDICPDCMKNLSIS
jgi:hypothetical protein